MNSISHFLVHNRQVYLVGNLKHNVAPVIYEGLDRDKKHNKLHIY